LAPLSFSLQMVFGKQEILSKQDTGGSAPNSDGTPYDGTANEEYWGIVDINRKKKITFDVVKEAYVNFDINQ